MKLRTLVTELTILMVVFGLIWLMAFWMTGAHNFAKPQLDINLHDTYFVLSWNLIIVPPFLGLITLIYLIKEGVMHKYQRKFQNLILIISNLLFIIRLSEFFVIIGVFTNSCGWTVYPPLSALPNKALSNEKPLAQYLDRINQIEQIMFIVLIVFIMVLALSAILTGRNWNIKANEIKA